MKTWKAQGEYKSINTGKPMILVMDKETGATVLEPLYKSRNIKKEKKTIMTPEKLKAVKQLWKNNFLGKLAKKNLAILKKENQ